MDEHAVYLLGKEMKQPQQDFKEEFKWVYLRGVFDSYGMINYCKKECKIPLKNELNDVKNYIESFCRIKYEIDEFSNMIFRGTNAIDFLGKIYDYSNESCRSSYNYNTYLTYLNVYKIPTCKYVKTMKECISPSKNNVSDEGYDLWIIGVDKKISEDNIRFETGIKVEPADGWHIEILPRSSLSSTGWMLANSVGLIDSSYRGTLKVALIRVDKNAKDLELPCKVVQMVLRPNSHYLFNEVSDLNDTQRGEGGFGSTNICKDFLKKSYC